MQKILEKLTKELFFSLGTVIKNIWLPTIVTLLELIILTTLLWATFNYMPHKIEFLSSLDFLSVFVVVMSVTLLKYTSKVSEDLEYNNDSKHKDSDWIEVDEAEMMLPVINTQLMRNETESTSKTIVPNVKQGLYPFIYDNNEDGWEGSTRE